MTQKKDRDRVMAEITLSHLLRLANEQGCTVSREQAAAFLNQGEHAYEMWKHMMQAAEDFVGCSLLRQYQPRKTQSAATRVSSVSVRGGTSNQGRSCELSL